MELVRPFIAISKADTGLTGGKGASLGEMIQAGIPVPEGYVVLSTAFERFLEEADLTQELEAILGTVNHEEMHTVEQAAEKIQALIVAAKMPADIAAEINKHFSNLGAKYIAVRSSATAEDSASAAWAGQLDTFLNTTEDKLLENVQRCWASLFTPRAIFYCFEKGLHESKISVAVVVQKMIQSERSGIAFSVHPVTEDHNQLIIEAGFGLGEAIVSGQVTPDSYVVEKTPRRIIDKNIATQVRALNRSENGRNRWTDIPEPKASSQVLSEEQILELSELIIKIENHYGFPCDIEWAFEKGKFYITQSRPITTLSQVAHNLEQGDYSAQEEFITEAGPKFTLEYTQSELGLLTVDTHIHLYAYGRADYVYLIEDDVVRCYITDNGKRIAREIGNEILDEMVFVGLQKKIETIKRELDSYKKLELNDQNAVSEWGRYVGLWHEFWNVYRYSNEHYSAGLAETLSEGKSDEESHREIKKIMEYLAAQRLELHTKAENLIRNGETEFIAYLNKRQPISFKEFMIMNEAEIRKVLAGGKIPIKKISTRLKGCVVYKVGNTWKVGTGATFTQWKAKIHKSLPRTISGSCAFPGKVRGKAFVHLSWVEAASIPVGSILVTGMTNPQMVPFLKNAIGIITDEGGIICHAAIISREMHIPCITGTLVATQKIKTGDTIEMDSEKGTVKIIT